jgi:hypothetical protein
LPINPPPVSSALALKSEQDLFMAVLSKGRLTNMMLERLLDLPEGATHLKENVTLRLGMVGQLSTSREINAAWNETKKKAAKLHPGKFILDGRSVLHWNDGSIKMLDKKISSSNYKKLNELADIENCNVNSMVSKLITSYKKNKKK